MSHSYILNKNKYLTDEERTLLVATINAKDDRNTLMLELALRTGARASELLLMKKSDINHAEKSIFIKGLKNSHDREMPLSLTLYNKLNAYAQNVNGERLFPVSYDRLYQIWLRYRSCNKKFHSLRHTFAIELYKRTRDIKLVQVALGHKSINTTMVYVDYIFRTEELRRMIL